jgi:hypothetical protein
MANLTDALDDVLARVAAGESLEDSVAHHPGLAGELAGLIRAREQLSVLSSAPALPADALAARRRQFLSIARAYKRQVTSANLLRRLGAWVWPAPRAGQPVLLSVAARAVIALVLVLSLVSGTVAAAQSSLPDSPLYRVKLTVEDARLNLARDPGQQATLSLSLASERIREMERLAIAQRPISSQVPLRLKNHLEAALGDAARATEPEMLRLLEQVRAMTQTLESAVSQVQVNAPREAGAQDALRQAGQALAQARQQAESGLADPNAFRNRYGRRQGAPVQPTPEATATPRPPTPTALLQPTLTLEATRTPRPSDMPPVTVTPQRNRAGTGQPPTSAPGPQVTRTPQQTGPGPQPTAGQGGSGPQATDKPEDGSGPGGSGGTGGNNDGGTRRP